MLVACWVKFGMHDIRDLQALVGSRTLVTGATGGFGLALCKAFRDNGQEVFGVGRNSNKLESLKKEGIIPLPVDIDDHQAVKELVQHLPVFDNIIISHGIHGARPMRMLSPDFSFNVVNTNLLSTLNMLSNILRARKINTPGRIVAISSISAYMGSSTTIPYAASKAGLDAAMRGLASDLLKKGITVNSIAPAGIATPLFEGSNADVLKDENYPLGPGSVEHVANAAIFLCMKGAKYITGETIILDGGSTYLE